MDEDKQGMMGDDAAADGATSSDDGTEQEAVSAPDTGEEEEMN